MCIEMHLSCMTHIFVCKTNIDMVLFYTVPKLFELVTKEKFGLTTQQKHLRTDTILHMMQECFNGAVEHRQWSAVLPFRRSKDKLMESSLYTEKYKICNRYRLPSSASIWLMNE